MLRSGLRAGQSPEPSSSRISASRKWPSSTSRTLSISTPSSLIERLSGGIDPGAIPPMSAWWPRAATKAEGWSLVAIEDRDDHRDIGQMRAAAIGIVQDIGIPAPDAAPVPSLPARIDDSSDALAHRPEVHRNVRSVCDKSALVVKNRAGEVEPFLDVDAGGGGLKSDAHLLGNGHEEVVEDFEPHRINLGPDRLVLSFDGDCSTENDRSVRRSLGAPTSFDNDRGSDIEDERWSLRSLRREPDRIRAIAASGLRERFDY